MNVICFHQATVYELDYTLDFIAIIDIYDDKHGLRGDAILESTKNDSRLIIGTCISRDAGVDEISKYCENLINNSDYCLSIFENATEI